MRFIISLPGCGNPVDALRAGAPLVAALPARTATASLMSRPPCGLPISPLLTEASYGDSFLG